MHPSAVKGRFRVLARHGGRLAAVALLLASVLSLVFAEPLTAVGQERGNDRRVSPADFKQYSNETTIVVADNTRATPYPLQITVAGLNGFITDLDVNLNRIQHDRPVDLDVMLVSPDGVAVVVMSDAGGDRNIALTSVLFDDEASAPIPQNASFVTGSYQVSNYPPSDDVFGDNFPSPLPPGTTLSAFDGYSANGTWSLFVRDDQEQFQGRLSGFRLDIKTTNAGPVAVDDFYKVRAGKKLKKGPNTGVLRNDRDADLPRDTLTVRELTDPKQGRLKLNPDGSFKFKAKKNAKGTTSFLYRVRDQAGRTDTGKVTIEIKERKDNDKDDKGKNNKKDKDKKKNRD